MDNENIIAGVGDEVILFAGFLLTAIIVILYLNIRSGRQRQTTEQRNEQVLVDDGDGDGDGNGSDGGGSDDEECDGDGEGLRQRIPPAPHFNLISLRLVTMQSSQLVNVRENITLHQLQRDYFNDEISNGQNVRFIYRGRLLTDMDQSLYNLGIQDQTTLHINVSPMIQDTNQEMPDQNQPYDMSSLFLPMITLILGVCWISLLMWPHIFTLPTKLMLFALSLLFIYLIYASR